MKDVYFESNNMRFFDLPEVICDYVLSFLPWRYRFFFLPRPLLCKSPIFHYAANTCADAQSSNTISPLSASVKKTTLLEYFETLCEHSHYTDRQIFQMLQTNSTGDDDFQIDFTFYWTLYQDKYHAGEWEDVRGTVSSQGVTISHEPFAKWLIRTFTNYSFQIQIMENEGWGSDDTCGFYAW